MSPSSEVLKVYRKTLSLRSHLATDILHIPKTSFSRVSHTENAEQQYDPKKCPNISSLQSTTTSKLHVINVRYCICNCSVLAINHLRSPKTLFSGSTYAASPSSSVLWSCAMYRLSYLSLPHSNGKTPSRGSAAGDWVLVAW